MLVKRDARPFFIVSNDVIDTGLSMAAVACYVYICRFGQAKMKDVRLHFGLTELDTERVCQELMDGGFVSDRPLEDEG